MLRLDVSLCDNTMDAAAASILTIWYPCAYKIQWALWGEAKELMHRSSLRQSESAL